MEPSEEYAAPLTEPDAIANLKSPDLSLRYYAAWWLGKNRTQSPDAIASLIAALDDEDDRTELGGYPLRRNAARALGKLGDRSAVPGLIRSLDCPDFYVREAAAQSLELLRDPSATPALMKLLEGGVASAMPIPGRPHLAEPYESVMEALGAIGASEAVSLVEPFLQHPIPRVQFAATRAMYQLTGNEMYGDRLVQALAEGDVKQKRIVLADLGAIGYLPAAEAIACSDAENSFKLLALKGLIESHAAEPLSTDSIRVLNLMDTLL
nr:HEAT repeat domain-containing protein [Microcoleus sp. FACHB-1515]